MKTGWLKQGDTWYYLDSSGKMATGSRRIDGKTYYFNSNGALKS
jgi:glucan-binding YG repeat protein